MLFERLRKKRQKEQEEYDAIIQEAKKNEEDAIAAEKSVWGCGLSVPDSVGLRSFSQFEQELLIPLYDRALCTQSYGSLFEDKAALKVCEACQTGKRKEHADAFSFLSAYEQSHYIAVCRNFIRRNSGVTIVEIGCGLSTLLFQVDNKKTHWIEIDMPEVLQLRRDFGFDRNSRIEQMACDPWDFTWINRVKSRASEDIVFVVHQRCLWWSAKKFKELVQDIDSQFSNALLLLNCVGGKAGKNKEGFHLYDLNAKSVFHSWTGKNPRVQVFETTFPSKEILEKVNREERRNIKRLYRDGSQILVDLKYTK